MKHHSLLYTDIFVKNVAHLAFKFGHNIFGLLIQTSDLESLGS